MRPADWDDVREIYRQGLLTDQATFETQVPTWKAWDANHRPDCRLVAKIDTGAAGWAALSQVSRRAVYAGVCEVSVYVAQQQRGQGVGKRLLLALVDASEAAGIWMLQASIFPENRASLALHHTCGFRTVGYRERIGRHHGVWRDTLLLERRSRQTGV